MRLLGKIERQINRTLALDEDTLIKLAALSGQVISLELINTGFIIFILPAAKGLYLQTNIEGNANVVIRGTPRDILSYLLHSKGKSGNFTGSIEVTGDVALAQDFQSIMLGLDLDWEEQLARWFGDTFAHKFGRILRATAGFAGHSGDKLQQDISEYLRFEVEMTVDKTQMDEFTSAVDTARNDVERLKLRISRLKHAIKAEAE